MIPEQVYAAIDASDDPRMRTDISSPLFVGASIRDLVDDALDPYVRDRYPALTATSSDECSLASAPAHGATTLGCCISRDLSDFEYAEMARLAYKAMRHSLSLIRFPNTIISIPEHTHTEPVSLEHAANQH